MAWETRNGRGRYYTRSRRDNGRVVREYVGTGPMAEAIALLDAQQRAEYLAERAAWQTERERMEDTEDRIQRFFESVTQLTGAALREAGYHRHHRGEWRKRRVNV